MEQSPCWEIQWSGKGETETTIKRDTNMCDGDTYNVDLAIGARELKLDLGQCKRLPCDGDTYNVDLAIGGKGTEINLGQCKLLPHAIPRHNNAVMLVEST